MSESVGERGKMVQRRSWRGNNHLVCKSRYDNNNELCLLRASRYVMTAELAGYFLQEMENLEEILRMCLNKQNSFPKLLILNYLERIWYFCNVLKNSFLVKLELWKIDDALFYSSVVSSFIANSKIKYTICVNNLQAFLVPILFSGQETKRVRFQQV